MDFLSLGGAFRATSGVSFHVDAGETLVILGESGSGKSVSASAIMGSSTRLRAISARVRSPMRGAISPRFRRGERRDLNGRRIAMIFQDPPLPSETPSIRSAGSWRRCSVSTAFATGAEARQRAVRHIEARGHPGAGESASTSIRPSFPAAASASMIGMAIALNRKSDCAEPTTALDVSVQAQTPRASEEAAGRRGLALS